MSDPCLYLASVIFTIKGERRTIEAVVMAVDEQDAIRSAMDAVRSLYPDADILGGMLEPLDDTPDAREETPNARGLTTPTVPASRTVH
jgi:hypothetical protein